MRELIKAQGSKLKAAAAALIAAVLLCTAPAAAKTIYIKTALTGGTASSLDGVSVGDLADGDMCYVYDSNNRHYVFEFQASATDSEDTDTHPFYVRPDDYSSQGVWYEQKTGYRDRPQYNLLPNSSFGCWSDSSLENVGDAIAVSGATDGVCYTSDTEGVQVGDLVEISGTTVYEVTAVTSDTSFTVNNTQYCSASAVSAYEVTPAHIGADALGPDGGWYKDTTVLVYRETGSNAKDGAYCAVKMVSTNQFDFFRWPLAEIAANGEFYKKFAGRTVTFGAWVKTSQYFVRLLVNDGVGTTYSSYHTGGGSYEWLEVTRTVSASISQFVLEITIESGAGPTIYVSQPILVFGDYIGAGNTMQPPGEVVWLESGVTLVDYYEASVSGSTTINVEAQTKGMVPKGAEALYVQLTGQCANTDKYLGLRSESGGKYGVRIEDVLVANKLHTATGWVPCDGDGDIYIERDGSFTNVTIRVLAVRMR